jgi:hypothetical protein
MDSELRTRSTVPCDHEWITLRRQLDGMDVVACLRCGTRETRPETRPDDYQAPSFNFRGYDAWKTNPSRP